MSSLITLYVSQEDFDSASEVLNEAVEWYKANEVGWGICWIKQILERIKELPIPEIMCFSCSSSKLSMDFQMRRVPNYTKHSYVADISVDKAFQIKSHIGPSYKWSLARCKIEGSGEMIKLQYMPFTHGVDRKWMSCMLHFILSYVLQQYLMNFLVMTFDVCRCTGKPCSHIKIPCHIPEPFPCSHSLKTLWAWWDIMQTSSCVTVVHKLLPKC